MKMPGKIWFAVLFLVIWAVISLSVVVPKTFAASSPSLGQADGFAVLAGTAISDVPTSSITGNVGLNAGASITGLTCAEVTGTIYDADGGYGGACRVTDASLLTQAQTDLGNAYDALSAAPNVACDGQDYGAVTQDLVGLSLVPGVYCADAFELSGTLTLDAGGDPNAVWIFRTTAAAAALVTTPGVGASVQFLNGIGSSCNVWWKVASSATIGSGTTFVGNILALTSIGMDSGATLNGRALARNAAVTLDTNTITRPTCAAAPTPTPTPTAAPSSDSDSNSSSDVLGDMTCFAPEITIVPKIIETKRVSPTSISLSWGPYEGIDTFIIEYGPQNGNWLYNTDVTGFTTSIDALPANQPMWFRVAARNDCMIGSFSDSVGGGGTPLLPSAGLGPPKTMSPWGVTIAVGLLAVSSVFVFIQCKRLFSLKG